MSSQRQKALNVIKLLKPKFGNVIFTGKRIMPVSFIRTGHPMLDYVMGKGIPIGRITEIFGNEGCGKTSICLQIVKQVQKQDGLVVWINGEKTLDKDYAEKLGVDTESMVIIESSGGEEIIEMVSALMRSENAPSLIVVDSVASITSSSEIELGIDDQRPAVNARMWNKAMRIWNAINKAKTTIILVNQIRYGIGGPRATTNVGGGMGIKFHASLRIELKAGQWITLKDKVIGHLIRIRSHKNKVTGFPHRSGEFEWYYDLRSTYMDELITVAVLLGLIEKSGAWIKYDGKTYKGAKGFKAAMKDNKNVKKQLEAKIADAKPLIDAKEVPELPDGE